MCGDVKWCLNFTIKVYALSSTNFIPWEIVADNHEINRYKDLMDKTAKYNRKYSTKVYIKQY